MSILTLAGSPSQRSRSSALLRHAAHLLRVRGLAIAELGLRDLPAEDLIEGRALYQGPQRATSHRTAAPRVVAGDQPQAGH